MTQKNLESLRFWSARRGSDGCPFGCELVLHVCKEQVDTVFEHDPWAQAKLGISTENTVHICMQLYVSIMWTPTLTDWLMDILFLFMVMYGVYGMYDPLGFGKLYILHVDI